MLGLVTLWAVSAYNCSLNGDISATGKCTCDPGWYGDDCERLRLAPAKRTAGLQVAGSSSWGGSVISVGDEHHMFAAFMDNNCGLNAWRPMSQIAHAVSATGPDGPYSLKDVIKPHFAHSPEVRPDGKGGFLIFHVGAGANNTLPCPDPAAHTCQFVSNCTAGCTGPEHPFMSGLDFYGPSMLYRSRSIDGPWSATDIGPCDKVPGCEKTPHYPGNGNDMNPTAVVLADGSVKMLWRSICYPCKGQSYYALAHAPSIDGPYTWETDNIFPRFKDCHIEDGFLYRNRRGWHALFHSDCEGTSGGAAGGHGFSVDGVSWTLHPHNAYDNTVVYEDSGPSVKLTRRERPKLIFDAETGRPTHLVNGVSLPSKDQCDHTFTFVQPIKIST